MAFDTIYVVNHSTLVSDTDVQSVVDTCQTQVSRDFAPLWFTDATLQFVGGDVSSVPARQQTLFIADNSDQADALGYHEIDTTDVPVGFCFVKSTIDAGDPWSGTFSHELLEMLGDPYVNLIAQGKLNDKDAFFALETCDAVENDTYTIDSVVVSNFVTPQFFILDTPHDQMDYLGKLSQPFTLSPGGYMAYFTEVNNWQQVFGDKLPEHQKEPEVLSRRHRRFN